MIESEVDFFFFWVEFLTQYVVSINQTGQVAKINDH